MRPHGMGLTALKLYEYDRDHGRESRDGVEGFPWGVWDRRAGAPFFTHTIVYTRRVPLVSVPTAPWGKRPAERNRVPGKRKSGKSRVTTLVERFLLINNW